MQVRTYPHGRSAVARPGRRSTRPFPTRSSRTGVARPGAGRLRRVSALALAATLAVLAACTASNDRVAEGDLGGIEIGPSTSSTTSTTLLEAATVTLPEGFVLPDTRTVALPPVVGRPKGEPDRSVPRLPVFGGAASLSGRVIGPDGPVGGAVVRIERFVGDDFGREEVVADGDGDWRATGLLGGRYKVRAWARPDLATLEPQAAFLANKDGHATLDIAVVRIEGEQIQGALDAAEPAVGQVHPFRALVTRLEVDENGIVVGAPLEGREVELTVLGGIRVAGEKKATTDAEGFAGFSVVCTAPGVHAVRITSMELTADVELPECADGVLDPDRLPPELPDFPVGSTFTVPTGGPYPAGTYAATTPGRCAVSFQEFVGDRWVANVSLDRVISPSNPIRSLVPVFGQPTCTYRRTA